MAVHHIIGSLYEHPYMVSTCDDELERTFISMQY